MHEPARRADDGAAEHLANALMSHAHAEDPKLRTELLAHLEGDARVLGPAGTGETMMPRGFIARIASTVFSSFLYTMCSQPRSPRYCEGRDRGGDRSSVVRGEGMDNGWTGRSGTSGDDGARSARGCALGWPGASRTWLRL